MQITKDGKKYNNKAGIRLTREEFIENVEKIYGKQFTYEKMVYVNSSTPIILICSKHGEIICKPSAIISYKGWPCYECKRENSYNEFIKNSLEKYGDKYKYDLKNYDMSYKPMLMICKEHGEFVSTPSTHLNNIGSGCERCKKNFINNRLLNRLKNNIRYRDYDFSKSVIIDQSNDIDIYCNIHKKFFNRQLGYILNSDKDVLCPDCQKEKKLIKFIKECRIKHTVEYDYSKITNFNSVDKLPIVCPKHGEFFQTATNHLASRNSCPVCLGGEKQIINREIFIKSAKEIHGDRYDYSLVRYYNTETSVEIICSIHGSFRQTPRNHIYNKNGCPKCNNGIQVSKDEVKWLNSLRVPIRSHIIEGYNVDGYNDTTNTVYEYLGDYWHGNLNVYKSDDKNKTNGKTFGELNKETFKRLEYLKGKGYNVIFIWESEWLKANKNS